MLDNAERATLLVRGIEASLSGDSSVIENLYTADVKAWSPAMSASSAAELAVEFEDREETFSDVELDISPLDVAGERACAEWVARLTHSRPVAADHEAVIGPTGLRLTLHGVTVAEFEGDRIRSFRQYWDEAELLAQLGRRPVD
jgi:hypothetical protein